MRGVAADQQRPGSTGARLFAADALLPAGWARNVLLEWDPRGRLVRVSSGQPQPSGVTVAAGPVIPGMPNLHSHAFQRAFAGLTESRTGHPRSSSRPDRDHDTFWGWRDRMYTFAAQLTPEQLEAIATWLFIEMVEAGYTSVCEFHYLHHDVDAKPYPEPATLAMCLVRAAERAGIRLTLLPVLYQASGFGGLAPRQSQRRFVMAVDQLLAMAATLRPACDAIGGRVGLAIHSLRAVTPDALREALSGFDSIDPHAPIHIHIAEQLQEVTDCLAWSGQRPVEWLLHHVDVNSRWCLVHATHLTRDEARRASCSGAIAGLCPTTEANLGDGIFDFAAWTEDGGGRWGVGSDSHACVDAAEELLMLEYSQRLQSQRRNVAATAAHPEVATAMTLAAVAGGAQACGELPSDPAGLSEGQPADLVVLDSADPRLAGLSAAQMLAAHVFASSRRSALRDVWVHGKQVVASRRHPLHDGAAGAFIATRAQLLHAVGNGVP